ncbi:MAG: RsiW-degrading membrane proteinase PrsW (M82 family) [Myxococcota bacterium]
MSTATIFVACFAPSLAFLGYFYLRDEYDREPLHLVLTVFAGGMLAGPISLVLFEFIERTAFYGDLQSVDVVSDMTKLIYAVFGIGLIEELSKFLVFWWFIHRRHVQLTEPVDAVIYAAAIALGFATIENWYFMMAVEEPVWSRAITLPFNHVLFSSFWGVTAGLVATEARGARLNLQGLTLAIVFHGLYDYVLFADSVSNFWVSPLVLILWLWVSLAIKDLLNRSPFRPRANPGREPE